MKKLILTFIVFFYTLLFVGCMKNDVYRVDNIDETKLVKVYIYRPYTSFHSLNPEKPFFYIDDKYIGKLGVGRELVINVLPGDHTFTVKGSLMFMPGFEHGKIQLKIEEGKEYYLRYALTPVFMGTTVTGKTRFQAVNQEYFQSKQ